MWSNRSLREQVYESACRSSLRRLSAAKWGKSLLMMCKENDARAHVRNDARAKARTLTRMHMHELAQKARAHGLKPERSDKKTVAYFNLLFTFWKFTLFIHFCIFSMCSVLQCHRLSQAYLQGGRPAVCSLRWTPHQLETFTTHLSR